MSNGIGRVWAVNAEGGDEGRPNGVGPVWIENADALGSKLPEPGADDAGKVLGVLNSSGDLGWVVDQSGTLTQVQSDWNETNTSTPSYIQNKPTIPSGTQLVPAATSADADKVLTVDAQGAPVWATGASYTAGGGVAIENDEISVKVGTGLKIDDVNTETGSLKATSDSTTRKGFEICPLTSDLLHKMSAQNGLTITTSVPFSFEPGTDRSVGFASWSSSGAGSIDKKLVLSSMKAQNPIPAGTSIVYNTNQILPSSNTTLAYVQEHISEFHVVIFNYFNNWSVGHFTAVEGSVQVETATYTITDSIQDAICVKNPIPDSTVGDAGKVLTVDAQGAPAWADGAASYTAGGGVAIENDEISVKVGTGLKMDDVTNTGTVSLKATSDSTTRKVFEICPLTSDILQNMSSPTGLTITTSVEFEFPYGLNKFIGLASWGAYDNGRIDKKLVFNKINNKVVHAGTSLVYNTNQIDPNSDTTLDYVQGHISEFHVVIFDFQNTTWRVAYFTAAEGSVQVETATCAITSTIQDALCVSNPIPDSTVGDAGKILTVNAQGAPSWAAAQSVTVDQTYNSASTNAQSGTAVAGALATVAGVPAVTSSDDDKVLKASYSGGTGSYSWEPEPTMLGLTAGSNVTITEANNAVTIAATDTTYTAGNMIAIDANNSNAIGVSTTAGITDIQQVAALPENPVSTVLYLIPET